MILFIILFVVTTLILTTISIRNATKEAEEFAKASIGSEVTLSADMESAREEMKAATSDDTSSDTKEKIQNFTRPTISLGDAMKIAESKYITGYKYTMTTYANVDEDKIELVETEMDKMGEVKVNSDDATNSSEASSRMPQGGNQNFEFSFDMKDIMSDYKSGDITIEAINNFELLDEYQDKTLTLTSGAVFTSDDENATIISYELAELNDLKVGDTITLQNTDTDKNITLNIVGIYDTSSDENQSQENNFMMNNSNKLYTNFSTAEKFLSEDDYNDGNYTISSCVYYLKDPNSYDAFIKEANTLVTDLTDKNLKLSIDQTTYDQMVGAISGVGSFSNVVFWVVVGASVLIITLVINIQVRERNYEIGVLLSLGEKKKKITMQILTELVITITVVMIIAVFVGTAISGVIGDKLLANQIEISQEQTGVNGARNMRNQTTSASTIDELDVSVGITEIGMLVGIGYLLVIISMVIPMMQIIKYDPKTILTRRE